MAMDQMNYENAVNTKNNEGVLKKQDQKNNTYTSDQERQTQASDPMNESTVNYWGAGSKTDELCWDLYWD